MDKISHVQKCPHPKGFVNILQKGINNFFKPSPGENLKGNRDVKQARI